MNTQRFRKRPVVIDAVQFTKENGEQVAKWCRAQTVEKLDGSLNLLVHTLEGDHWANPGDWIIRGIKGEHYPCRADIFEATYEPVSE